MGDQKKWLGTRAGQHASVVFVVKEDDGMPIIDFQPGDFGTMHLAYCAQLIVKMLVATEAARLSNDLDKEWTDGREDGADAAPVDVG